MTETPYSLKPMPSEIRRIIDETIRRLGDEATWCQGIACMDKDAQPCDPLSDDARAWCARAMLFRVEHELLPRSRAIQYPIWRAVNEKAGGYGELTRLNDADGGREKAVAELRDIQEELCPAPVRRVAR